MPQHGVTSCAHRHRPAAAGTDITLVGVREDCFASLAMTALLSCDSLALYGERMNDFASTARLRWSLAAALERIA